MIMPRNMPSDAYMDDQAEKFDRADQAESEQKLRSALASGALTCIGEWITRGRGGVTNRAFRADIVLLSISPAISAVRLSERGLGRSAAWRHAPASQ